jgi:predicted translin family RNA/ssDNA-binding protein
LWRLFRNILKYLPPFDDIWKEELNHLFKELKERFPNKEPVLEYMRLIILYSEQLSEDSMRECDEEVRARLNELSHYVFELKKKEDEKKVSVLPKGRTQK